MHSTMGTPSYTQVNKQLSFNSPACSTPNASCSTLNTCTTTTENNGVSSQVPSHVWQLVYKTDSATIHVYDDQAFDHLESMVLELYGNPERMVNDIGNIYRGQVTTADGCRRSVTITFYRTHLVRIQAPGYYAWITDVLPSLATKVMIKLNNQLSSPNQTVSCIQHHKSSPHVPTPCFRPPCSTPTASTPTCSSMPSPILSSPTPSPHVPSNIIQELITTLISKTEDKVKYQVENNLLNTRVNELKAENAELLQQLTEKQVNLEMMMSRVNEVDLFEFQSVCDKKLLESREAEFAKERQHLLNQIQELSTSTCAKSCTSKPAEMTYRDAVISTPKPDSLPKSKSTDKQNQWTTTKVKKLPTTTQATPRPISTSNRFSVLSSDALNENGDNDEHEKCNEASSSGKQCGQRTPTVQTSETRKPKIVIFGDSIAKRIDSQRLSRDANIVNSSVSGRKIEQVTKDITDQTCANADSIIVHVGTNNLQKDTLESIKGKLHAMSANLKSHITANCKVAISSIVNRTDRLDLSSKLMAANNVISDMCKELNWTYIDNYAVCDLCTDGLHPNKKGMSYIATNFQNFLFSAHPSLFRQGRKKSYHRRQNQKSQEPLLGNAPAWLTYLMSGIKMNVPQ